MATGYFNESFDASECGENIDVTKETIENKENIDNYDYFDFDKNIKYKRRFSFPKMSVKVLNDFRRGSYHGNLSTEDESISEDENDFVHNNNNDKMSRKHKNIKFEKKFLKFSTYANKKTKSKTVKAETVLNSDENNNKEGDINTTKISNEPEDKSTVSKNYKYRFLSEDSIEKETNASNEDVEDDDKSNKLINKTNDEKPRTLLDRAMEYHRNKRP